MLLKLANELFNVEGVCPDALMKAYLVPDVNAARECTSSGHASHSHASIRSTSAHAIHITPQLIAEERTYAEQADYPEAYLSRIALLRQVAELGPKLGMFVAHMATLEYQGHAYAFAAPSGTGKSTHVRLWQQAFGDDISIINGDKPLLRLATEKKSTGECNTESADTSAKTSIFAYGSPWAGKEHWHVNTCAPLAGICFLSRGTHDKCRSVTAAEALPRALKQIHMPQNPESALLTLDFLDVLLREVPLFELSCTISENAVKASFEAMTGLNFKDCTRKVHHEN